MIKAQLQRSGIIFGASSGVGKALVKLLKEDVYLYAVSRSGLKVIESNNVSYYQCDVTQYKAVHSLFKEVTQYHSIDFVINCIGIGFYSPLNRDFSEYWMKIVQTNIVGLANVISCLNELGIVLQNFVYIGSLAAYRSSATAGNLIYSSSKAATLRVVQEYRKKLRECGINTKVTLITPGFIENTDFSKNFFNADPDSSINLFSKFKSLQPIDVAHVIHYALNTPEHVEISEIVVRPREQPD